MTLNLIRPSRPTDDVTESELHTTELIFDHTSHKLSMPYVGTVVSGKKQLEALEQCIPPLRHVLQVSRYQSRRLANWFEIATKIETFVQ